VPCNNHKKQTITTFNGNNGMLASLSYVTALTQSQEPLKEGNRFWLRLVTVLTPTHSLKRCTASKPCPQRKARATEKIAAGNLFLNGLYGSRTM